MYLSSKSGEALNKMTRAELLEQIRSRRAQLETVLVQFSPEHMLTPALPGHWSVKDVLAHLGWWAQRIVNTYHTLRQGNIPDPHLEALGIDELNAQVFAEHEGRPLAEVRREERQAYQALLALAESAPEADLFDPNRFAWTEGQPFVEWVKGNTYEHYAEHLPDLQAWLSRSQTI
jgi:hypothetical protein